jgi:hypothetical protein
MKCPGQDSRYWKPGAIFETECPKCGNTLEFFKDDTTRKCAKCGNKIVNPEMDFGCASYCQFAEQCIGSLPEEVLANKQDLFKDRVAVEVKRHFGRDFKGIGRAMKVGRYAEKIGKAEKGNLGVILVAAFLHGVDAGKREELTTAKEILTKLQAGDELISEVSDIILNHADAKEDSSPNLKTVHDAYAIVILEENMKNGDEGQKGLKLEIESVFLTESGREMARAMIP